MSTKQIDLVINASGLVRIRTDYRPPISPCIELTREEAIKLADAIRAAFPLDALGRL